MAQMAAFDALAEDYDENFTHRPAAQWLRHRARTAVRQYLPDSAHVLDVGCGTGEDALWLAELGHSVLATDVSTEMLRRARQKISRAPAGVSSRVRFDQLDAAMPREQAAARPFDLVWSNFGALNCVEDLNPLLEYAAEHTKEDGIAAFVVMGRFCLWETIGSLCRGQFRRAFRRWPGYAEFTAGKVRQPVWYHSPKLIRRQAKPLFDCIDLAGLGVLIPPSEFFALCERRPNLFRRLANIESKIDRTWPFDRIGDHYLIVLRKRHAGDGR